MERILVGTDGSECSAHAVRWAHREAELRRLPLVAVIAWNAPDDPHARLGERSPTHHCEVDALRALERYLEQALGRDAAEGVERRAVWDLPGPGLVNAAVGATLLVVGPRGLGPLRGALLGSVSQHCLQHAPCPVAVVRPHDPAPEDAPGRIIVGIDGSPPSQHALRWAIGEARVRGAAVEVVHAWTLPLLGAAVDATLSFDPRSIEDAARGTMAAAVASEDTSGLAHGVRQRLVVGSGASSLLDASEGADLLVVGSRGMGGFRGFLLGSVSLQVAHHATCPVVVVPTAP